MDIHTLSSDEIAEIIVTRFQGLKERSEPQLEEVFRNILWASNQYVPSESGSVSLGDLRPGKPPQLMFIASFGGEQAQLVPGTHFPATRGISGRVYRTGKACIRNDVTKDRAFYKAVDEKTHFTTRSMMCVPIMMEGSPCGVVSMLNRLHPSGFRKRDLRLVEVFCRYISTSVQNLVSYYLQRELARRDHLSGLFNDRSFYERLLWEMRLAERDGHEVGLIFLDLDHFKGVVDRHGHLVGSQVLAEVGRLLKKTVCHPGAALARYGGDEYVVILPRADRETCLKVAEDVRLAIKNSIYLTEPMADGTPALNITGRFTASIGLAMLSQCPPLPLEARRHLFIRCADEAMYSAKRGGKNQVCVFGGS